MALQVGAAHGQSIQTLALVPTAGWRVELRIRSSEGLTSTVLSQLSRSMTSPLDANFNDYKKAENKALEILKEMLSASVKPLDIELALLVAIF